MSVEVRCRKCGEPFEPNGQVYCGGDFCLSCREEPQEAVADARKEAFEEFKRMGYLDDEADRKAQEFALDVEQRRRERGE